MSRGAVSTRGDLEGGDRHRDCLRAGRAAVLTPFLLYGVDPLAALFEVVSALSTCGLSAGVAGPELHPLLKIVLCADMLMGQVEVMAFLIRIDPRTWWGRTTEETHENRVDQAGLTTVGAAEIPDPAGRVVIVERTRRIEALVDTLDCGLFTATARTGGAQGGRAPAHQRVVLFADNVCQHRPSLVGRSLGFRRILLRSTTRNSSRSASNWA